MRKEAGMPRVERWLWRGLIVLYVPLMILGPLMGMFGETYIGQANPAVNMLSGTAYWLSASLLPGSPAGARPTATAGGMALRRRGCVRAAWVVLLTPLLVLAAVAGLDMAAGALSGM